MPVVKVEWMIGRTEEQKQELAARITEAVTEVALVRPEEVWILFRDIAAENWAVGGSLVSRFERPPMD